MGNLEQLNSNKVSILLQIRDGINALVSSINTTSTIPHSGGYAGSTPYEEQIPRHGMTESPTFASTLSQHPVVGLQT